MSKWVEFHRITVHEIETSMCPMALWVFPKPRPNRYYKDPRTGDIIFEKIRVEKARGTKGAITKTLYPPERATMDEDEKRAINLELDILKRLITESALDDMNRPFLKHFAQSRMTKKLKEKRNELCDYYIRKLLEEQAKKEKTK